jgi:nucleotide-binding universal stress UspA family protein
MDKRRKEDAMIKIETILVPTDFSEFSKYALKYSIAFAQTFKARIILIHITPEREMDAIRQASVHMQGENLEELVKQRKAEDRKQLDEFIPPELKKGITVETIHRVGIPFMEIIKAAREKEVDLIVIATHGKSGLSHILFGSVAEKVVRKAPCPVLSIRHPEHEFIMP